MFRIQSVILAAGKGTRMKSKRVKLLHTLRGRSLISLDLDSHAPVSTLTPVVVVGVDAEAVMAASAGRATFAHQAQPQGTGHALMCAREACAAAGGAEQVIVTYGDMPLIRPESLASISALQRASGAAVTMLTFINDNPRGFGRIARGNDGSVQAIVEEVDCTPEQLRIKELNPGVYCFDGAWVWNALNKLTPNPRKHEYFITDLVSVAVSEGRSVQAVVSDDPDELLGINTRVDLADAETAYRKRLNRAHMLNGVTLVDPATTYIDPDVQIGADTVIQPNTHLLAGTHVGEDCEVGPNSVLRAATVGDRCAVRQSIIEDSVLEDDVQMGPFCRIRAGTRLLSGSYLGNFVEMKNTRFGHGAKAGHFSYAGDADVGDDVNYSAGVITANFDGKHKHRTVIEAGAFVGSDSVLRAPVRVGRNARVGAGAVVTHDVPDGETVAGVPARPLKPRG
jgi:bifunctional UDP-N-acetylglucosamine pyrophosphorylase / glucosamine-1-phosphate N-acetyltransferase